MPAQSRDARPCISTHKNRRTAVGKFLATGSRGTCTAFFNATSSVAPRASLLIKTGARPCVSGTMLPYAQIHNQGGTIIQKPTFKQRIYFSYLAQEAYKSGNTSIGNMYSAFSTAKKLNIVITKRQFIGNSAGLNKRITRQIQARLSQILLTP